MTTTEKLNNRRTSSSMTKMSKFSKFPNHLKSIAVGPGTLICHCGMITTPKHPYHYIKKSRKIKHRLNLIVLLEPYWNPNPKVIHKSCLQGVSLPFASILMHVAPFLEVLSCHVLRGRKSLPHGQQIQQHI